MGESALILSFGTEAELERAAGRVAVGWLRAGLRPLLIGLRGELGSGKTTWVRAMLRGLGYDGRVPSPTYTLVEQYAIGGLTIAHLDLYRLRGGDELENVGIRDLLGVDAAWLLVEWPERGDVVASLADLSIDFDILGATARRVVLRARTDAGRLALGAVADLDSSNAF